jgi:hypothetical protein
MEGNNKGRSRWKDLADPWSEKEGLLAGILWRHPPLIDIGHGGCDCPGRSGRAESSQVACRSAMRPWCEAMMNQSLYQDIEMAVFGIRLERRHLTALANRAVRFLIEIAWHKFDRNQEEGRSRTKGPPGCVFK